MRLRVILTHSLPFCMITLIQAEDTGTNKPNFAVGYYNSQNVIEDTNYSRTDMVKRFGQVMAFETSRDIADRFGPWTGLGRTREMSERYGIHDTIRKDGVTAVRNTLSDAARETAVFYFGDFIDHWEMYGRGLGDSIFDSALGLFGRSVKDSVGNTLEERASESAFSSDFSASRSEWQSSLEHEPRLTYGIRPWRSNPYAYGDLKLGRWENRPIIELSLRLRYIFPGTEQTEFQVLVPLWANFTLNSEFKIAPFDVMRRDDSRTVFALGIGRSNGDRFHPRYAGLQFYQYPRETVAVMMLTFSF